MSSELFRKVRLLKSREDVLTATKALSNYLCGISYHISEDEPELKKLLGGGHGTSQVTLTEGEEIRHLPLSDLKKLAFYNSYHWRLLSSFLDQGGSEEKIHVTPRLLRRLILSTPHWLKTGAGNERLEMDIAGEAKLTPRQLFVVLRTLSNSLHSIKWNVVMHSFRNAISSPEFLERAVKSPDLAYFGSKTLHESLQDFEKARESGDVSHLRNWHYKILSGASGFSNALPEEIDFLSQRGLSPETIKELMGNATGNYSMRVLLSPRAVTVTDRGLGKLYATISRFRRGGGTSTVFQEREAKIERKTEGQETTTRLSFA